MAVRITSVAMAGTCVAAGHTKYGRSAGHHPVDRQLVMVAPAVGHIGEIEERDAARQCQRRQWPQCGVDVLNGRVRPYREEHDAGDQRQVQIAVGIAGKPGPLVTGGLPHPPLGTRRQTEIGPPQRCRDQHAEHERGDNTRTVQVPATRTEFHDRLAQRNDDDRAVTLDEIGRCDPKAAHPDGERGAVVEHGGEDPHRLAVRGAQKRGDDDECGRRDKSKRHAPASRLQLRILA